MNDIFEQKYFEILLESEQEDEINKFKAKMVTAVKCEILTKNDKIKKYLEENDIKKFLEVTLNNKPLEAFIKRTGVKLKAIESLFTNNNSNNSNEGQKPEGNGQKQEEKDKKSENNKNETAVTIPQNG